MAEEKVGVEFEFKTGTLRGQLREATQELIKSVAVLVAGILLLVPGFLTDIIGVLLLFSPIQQFLFVKLLPYFRFYSFSESNRQGNTFEGKFTRKDEDQTKLK
jgi:UPF0716 protein FxsA